MGGATAMRRRAQIAARTAIRYVRSRMGTDDATSLATLRERLRGAGLRVTGARIGVLRVLIAARAPMSHSEVYEHLSDQSVDRVTVYRNLVDLAEANLVRRTDVGDHVWRFEWSESVGSDTHGHPHFVCSDCGAVACLPLSAVALRAVRGTPRSLKQRHVQVHVRGLCDACV
jgi:Fur family ferric uptake transcriptional regulator